MKILRLDELTSLFDTSRTDLRFAMSGNGAVPWSCLSAIDSTVESYTLHLLNAPPGLPDREGVTLETAFVGAGMRKSPRLKYHPSRLSHVPHLYRERLPVDVAVVHTSAPIDGKVSLGTEVDVVPAIIEHTKARGGIVIAQSNPQMPYTFGDGEYSVDIFDGIVEVDEPIATLPVSTGASGARAESAARIGSLVSERVNDGATMQLGIGEIPDATLAGLMQKKNLGIWSEMLADGILALDDAGALDPDRLIVSSFIYGSTDLYKWCHLNDRVRILRTETTNSPGRIAENPAMTSVNTALQVDLLDQANASRIKARIFSGFGGQTDFTVGAMHSPGGQAIMALRSWHPKANVSTIVPLLDEPVTSFQHSMIVTEQGVAELVGCSEKEQARNIIMRAAHPDAREELWEEARELGLA